MNKRKPYVYKRIIAYMIDLIIVTLISGILTIVFVDNTDYNKDTERLVEVTQKLTSGEITQEEYYKEFDSINYDLTKDSVSVTIITCCVSIVYYVILCFYCHGITLGKYFMKIRIVSANDKELNIGNYLLRSLIVNLILSNVLSVVLVKFLSKENFIMYYSKVSNVLTVLLLVSFILIMYRDDGRGIQDFMGNTKIINFKDEQERNQM